MIVLMVGWLHVITSLSKRCQCYPPRASERIWEHCEFLYKWFSRRERHLFYVTFVCNMSITKRVNGNYFIKTDFLEKKFLEKIQG